MPFRFVFIFVTKVEEREVAMKWRARNIEHYREYQRDYQRKYNKKWKKRYFAEHPEKKQEYEAYKKEWHHNNWLQNKERLSAEHRIWYQKNKRQVNARQRARRAELRKQKTSL